MGLGVDEGLGGGMGGLGMGGGTVGVGRISQRL